MGNKDKRLIRQKAFSYLRQYGDNIYTKLTNICGKTGQYDVPTELFQKRTKRSNRSLISWRTVKNNHLSIEQLKSFEGGVVVEFINNDFFVESNRENCVFKDLCNLIGSNDDVSAIITIRSEGGNSSSAIQRSAFSKLINNTVVFYRGEKIRITKDNYMDYAIRQDIAGKGTGNETWSGFLFISIRGGQQDTIETHKGQELTLFNPACEYASAEVCTDIDLVVSYFMMKSININNLNNSQRFEHLNLISSIEECLKESLYESEAYTGNLFDWCKDQYCLSFYDNQLTDPIQLKQITIKDFSKKDREGYSIDFTHNEAVVLNKFYWDKKKNCVLSPARPSNIFWSFHLSNMMQQDYTLDNYFKYEEERFNKRKELISKVNS